jgi:serine/threonine-protein kinase
VTPPSPEQLQLAAALSGHYTIDREIGRGGMGIVFLARDLRLDRDVAIKTLPAHLAGDPTIRERFLREARMAASLSHPNIVPIHRADEANGLVFFIMGYVRGPSAATLVREQGRLGAAHTVAILTDVAAALAYAHGRGVIHRDIKAENILLDSTADRAMVTDFGIARLAEAAPMTATGQVLGTVFYMSPEQVAGEPLDGRSDLYSLGVLGYFLLSGRFPFEHETPSAVLVSHVTRRAPPLRQVAPYVHSAVAAIIDRLLLKPPTDRFESAGALHDALQRLPEAAFTERKAVQPAVLSSTEANAIWERAALLQQLTGQADVIAPPVSARPDVRQPPASLTSGYRVDSVREAAREAGIDTRYVDRALVERGAVVAPDVAIVREGTAMAEPPSVLLGARTRLEYEVTLEGELPASALEDLADTLRRAVGEIGTIGVVGRSLTFTTDRTSSPGGTYPRRMEVSVTTRHGRTVVRGFEDLRQFAQGMFWGISGGVGGGVGGATFGSIMGATQGALPAVAVAAGLAVAGLSVVGARLGLRAFVRRRDASLRAIVARLAGDVREMIAQPSLPTRDRPRLPR